MKFDKQHAFTGYANYYQNARPDYPQIIFLDLINFWHEQKENIFLQPIIADIGCGTGIATRNIYAALNCQCKIIGIEPKHEMRNLAIASTPAQRAMKNFGADNTISHIFNLANN